jgi:hypothetical protein
MILDDINLLLEINKPTWWNKPLSPTASKIAKGIAIGAGATGILGSAAIATEAYRRHKNNRILNQILNK